MRKAQQYEIIAFLKEEILYFKTKSKGATYDKFISDKDLRKILNATLNEIVLATVDLAGECLRKSQNASPTLTERLYFQRESFLEI